jgi:pyruvate dehydrogenase E2 component (dihydrolipoamide acetyltransferase)
MSIFTMPSLGADMEEGKLVEWLVKPGDKVARGDIVAVVETQKGAVEIEIFESGEIAELLAEPGKTLPVGAPLARLGVAGEAEVGATVTSPMPSRETPKPAEMPAITPVAPVPKPSGGAVLSSPAARIRAAELKIALETVAGSGPGGAVLLSDVERHASAGHAPAAEPAKAGLPKAKPGLDMTEMRRAIAAAMTRAKREIPHYYLCHEIDLQAAQDRLSALNAVRTPDRRLLMGALLIHATVRALAKVPELNGRFEGDPYARRRRPLRPGHRHARRRADRARHPRCAGEMDPTRSWKRCATSSPAPAPAGCATARSRKARSPCRAWARPGSMRSSA